MLDTIDFDALAAPLAGDNPAGVDLRTDEENGALFRSVRDARNDARRIERSADENGEDGSAALSQWRFVREQGEKILLEHSKDLEIACYMTEALARLDGFAGVTAGFHLSRLLIENHWDNLYPLPDEEGLVTRVLPLAWLNGEDREGVLIAPLSRIPLTQGNTVGPFVMWQYNQAAELVSNTDPAARADRIAQGAVTQDQIAKAATETSIEFFQQLIADIRECQDEFEALCELLIEKCGYEHAPPNGRIRETLENILTAVRTISKERLSLAGVGETSNGVGGLSVTNRIGGIASVSVGTGQIATRDDAFRVLLSIADFFEQTEPQSLLPAQIRRVVHWGRLGPQEFFRELIEDETALSQMFKLVGIKPKESDGEDLS